MVKYELLGMTCMHCKKTVEKIFAENGKQAIADLDSESVSLEENLTSEEVQSLRIRLEEDGYTLGNLT